VNPEDELRTLPAIEPSDTLTARVRRAGQRELSAAHGPRWRFWALQAFTRLALPAAIAWTVVGYLRWAVLTASALQR
jgi:hypothetical protein